MMPAILAAVAAAAVLLVVYALIPVRAQVAAATSPTDMRASTVTRLSSQSRRDYARRMLEQSGNPKGWTVDRYVHECMVNAAMMGGGAMVVVAFGSMILALPPLMMGALVVAAGVIGIRAGWRSPRGTLARASARRQTEALLQLPSLLVTMATAVSARASTLNALRESVNELPQGTLRGEFDLVLAALDHGESLPRALLMLRTRLPLPGIEETTQKILDAARTGSRSDAALVELATKLTREAGAIRRLQIQKIKLQVMGIVMMFLAPAVGIFMMFPIVGSTFDALGSVS